MNGMKIAIDINPIDLENWSYGWSLSVQRHSPDPRFFEKTWDLIVSRSPKLRKARAPSVMAQIPGFFKKPGI
jgi:hypothetical protein